MLARLRYQLKLAYLKWRLSRCSPECRYWLIEIGTRLK